MHIVLIAAVAFFVYFLVGEVFSLPDFIYMIGAGYFEELITRLSQMHYTENTKNLYDSVQGKTKVYALMGSIFRNIGIPIVVMFSLLGFIAGFGIPGFLSSGDDRKPIANAWKTGMLGVKAVGIMMATVMVAASITTIMVLLTKGSMSKDAIYAFLGGGALMFTFGIWYYGDKVGVQKFVFHFIIYGLAGLGVTLEIFSKIFPEMISPAIEILQSSKNMTPEKFGKQKYAEFYPFVVGGLILLAALHARKKSGARAIFILIAGIALSLSWMKGDTGIAAVIGGLITFITFSDKLSSSDGGSEGSGQFGGSASVLVAVLVVLGGLLLVSELWEYNAHAQSVKERRAAAGLSRSSKNDAAKAVSFTKSDCLGGEEKFAEEANLPSPKGYIVKASGWHCVKADVIGSPSVKGAMLLCPEAKPLEVITLVDNHPQCKGNRFIPNKGDVLTAALNAQGVSAKARVSYREM